MDLFVNLITGWMATFGLSFAIALTEGPFGLFKRARIKIETKTKAEWVKAGVRCPICISFWVGIPVAYGMDGGVVMWLSSLGFVCVVTSLSPE